MSYLKMMARLVPPMPLLSTNQGGALGTFTVSAVQGIVS